MTKKYKLTRNSVTADNRTLYQIRALKDFGSVEAGDLGGYIETEKNLSHDGTCWISEDACVFGDAWVFGNAQVYGKARVYGNVRVYGNARVSEHARIFGHAWVYGNAWIYGNAHVYGNAWIYGNARVYGDAARIFGNAHVYGHAHVSGSARVSGDADLGYIPVNFDCDFDPYKTLKEILNYSEILPTLLGLNKNLDKFISTILTNYRKK